MKIINNIPLTLFQEVEVGEVFQCVGAIFMRTDDNINTEFGTMNAVNLESGITASFCPDDMVVRLPKAHVVIE